MYVHVLLHWWRLFHPPASLCQGHVRIWTWDSCQCITNYTTEETWNQIRLNTDYIVEIANVLSCHVKSLESLQKSYFFSLFDFGPGQGPQKDHVGGCCNINIRDFVVVHGRSTLQSPHSPWTLRRPCCVVHYRRGPHRDLGDSGRHGEAHARTSQSPLFTNKTWAILFSSRGGHCLHTRRQHLWIVMWWRFHNRESILYTKRRFVGGMVLHASKMHAPFHSSAYKMPPVCIPFARARDDGNPPQNSFGWQSMLKLLCQ